MNIKTTIKTLAVLGLAVLFFSCQSKNNESLKTIDQHIYASIDVNNASIEVIDTLFVPVKIWNSWQNHSFYLNSALMFDESKSSPISIIKEDSNDKQKKYVAKKSDLSNSDVVILVYNYSGVIKDEIVSGAAEYARGFSDTDGLISDNGVYLAGASYWLPSFEGKDLSTYTLNVSINEGWNVVSQGVRTKNIETAGKQNIIYDCDKPMDETYLIAAQWTEYDTTSHNVLIQAFLRTPDQELANKYLSVTSDYLNLYENLIGDYPFSKFALVENFWETGYGMPSFTLLGEKVIRFPWILHSSYPHELLHNYWGNSVYVDYSTGNWCEGITVYMADHLIKEQQGLGEAYRRSTLEKFTNYVNSDNDFPVSKFLNRNNSAEEAIGYGKALMMNNMLRTMVGDEKFLAAYKHFYENNKFRYASFDDIRISFETISGLDLKLFFDQWINRTGAPEITLSKVESKNIEEKFELKFELNQVQTDELFIVDVPVAIYLEKDSAVVLKNLKMESKNQNFTFSFDKRPLAISVDPQFNIMRRLDSSEIPATLSQAFGQKQSTIILPAKSKFLKDYKVLAQLWSESQTAQGNTITVVYDNEINSIPENCGVWVIGFENKFNLVSEFIETNNNNLQADQIEKIKVLEKNGSLVFVSKTEINPDFPISFVGANNSSAISGLIRKLPHYGKYSLLGFEGETAKNKLKATLPVNNSAMYYKIPYSEEVGEITAKLTPRKALSE